MRGELIALDLETTGLDVEKDAIIEIGAVRIRDGQVIEEYSTLVNPGFVIPAETTHITGIHQDDLRDAPLLTTVLPDVAAFVGNTPVIAHNVQFDIGFMRRFGILKSNLPIDTFDLASILLPRTPRYSLSSLAAVFEIDLENAHRALDDARATAILYWHLWEKLIALPSPILFEITRGLQNFQWDTGAVFRAAYDEIKSQGDADAIESVLHVFEPSNKDLKPLKAHDVLDTIQMSDIDAILGEDGTLSKQLLHYEHRQEQVMMAQSIAHTFNEGEHLMVEAGTGTGKSLAYLIPAVLWAAKNNQRIVVSTNTINLQDQLINNDIPLLQDLMEQPFKAAVMKGRGNYLCPRRLASVRRRLPSNLDELKTLAKVLVWLQESQTGDKGELSLRSGEYFVWNRLSAEDEDCSLHRCQAQMAGTCPYFKARKEAESAHIVVSNHALLVSDAVSDNAVLPSYKYLIADEAHQLEDAVTNGLSFRIDQQGLMRRLIDLGGVNAGLLGDLLRNAKMSVPDKHAMRLEMFIQDIGQTARAMQALSSKFFETIYQFIHDSRSDNNYRIRIDTKRRDHSAFQMVGRDWETLSEYFDVVTDAMGQLADAMRQLEKYNIPSFDDHLNAAAAAARNLSEIRSELDALVMKPDANRVYWINNARSAEWIALQSAPLHVGPLMEQYIWHEKQSVILTSATLRSAGSFQFTRQRLFAESATELALGSPFDYKRSTLIFIPDDMPQPNERGYQSMVERGIVELAAELNGRMLVLFTSYSQLRETAANISPRLALGNITIYDQATGGSRETLLESFKSTEKAVLLGTRSFWEGIDIPGNDLSALVIVRLPFAVPNDPIFAARSGTYSDAFNDYAVPDAILRFRQGFGRLIRTQTDRGIVAIFDSRVIHKSYGMKFLESLPDATLEYGKLDEIAKRATDWLEQE
ncbi:MAG: helicase C-terminal domain-containing protein [Phototrophicaceae bacterium]